MIKSIEDYINEIKSIKSKWFPKDKYPDIWYRGVNDIDYNLEPGAYWRKDYDEISAISTFRVLTPTLINEEPTDAWDWYFLMQHYGLPTRLLDWSESPLQALHFALTNKKEKINPAIWILDPLALNYSSQELDFVCIPQGFKDSNNENKYDAWLPPVCFKNATPINSNLGPILKSNKGPLAIFPIRSKSNPRLHAQRGVFTLHGTDPTPINHMKIEDAIGVSKLLKIEIDNSAVDELLDILWTLGINKSSTYPEPNSVSEDVLKMYGH